MVKQEIQQGFSHLLNIQKENGLNQLQEVGRNS